MASKAEDLDDCEFWLPPQFLADDDLKKGEPGTGFLYGGFPSSPVESVNETESDEDDFISGLTRKMARSTLEDDSDFEYNCGKAWRLSGSPQSTLCGILGGGLGCNQVSSRGSTNCSSRASSPPLPAELPGKADGGAWDLLFAAAGDVARMKMMEESAAAARLYPNQNGIWAPPRNASPVGVPSPKTSMPQSLGLMNSNQLPQHSNYQELHMAQLQRLKQHEMGMQGRNGRVGLIPSLNSNHPQANLSSWPTPQQSLQQPCRGSGMRAVFIGNPGGAKRECSGTGVFLPRTVGTPAEPRKKPVCSTVLLPEKVVHALNLNLEARGHQPQLLQPRYTHLHDGAGLKNQRSNGRVQAQQRRNLRPSPACSVSQELRLPQEWTY
ncbi:PREDICTED: uncharacterized protein LOC109150907 isoform X2 [Ipomoea nil]|uniref:uncharacterized protein LOC109150907 isoform X2 n=1 Tax=Ipomoea nil TaxID=35883 RepID=UPI000900ED38|nr:PREDICTED: uncharacterized protein LOC109150907 isoform X2 [Ipomoea nil]